MGGEGFPIDIIIFAAIAAFIVFRLRSVLGRRTGNERPPPKSMTQRTESGADKVVPLPTRDAPEQVRDFTYEKVEPGTPLESGLTRIKSADKNFNADEFLAGARTAFEMIIDAFSAGKMEDLRAFLSDEVYDNFDRAIRTREEAEQTLDTAVVGINKSDIIEARMDGKYGFLTLKFVSEQINVTRDKDGAPVDGEPDHVAEVTDIWTFMRDTRSRDPNWVLVETRSSN